MKITFYIYLLLISNFVFAQNLLPAISPPPAGQTFPTGWGYYTNPSSPDPNKNILVSNGFYTALANSPAYSVPSYMYNVSYINDPVNGYDDWDIHTSADYAAGAVNTNWTFTVVISGRSLGDLSTSPNSGAYVGFVEFDANHNVINNQWIAPLSYDPGRQTGTFPWKRLYATYKVRSGVAYIRPRIFSWGKSGGGELYINKASLYSGSATEDASLTVPVTDFPASTINLPVIYNANPSNLSLPSNWSFWLNPSVPDPTGSYNTFVQNGYSPTNNTSGISSHLYARTYLTDNTNGHDDWCVNPTLFYKAGTVGTYWTFAAIISGRSLGDLTSDIHRGAYLSFTEFDANYNVIGGQYVAPLTNDPGAQTGTFPWKRIYATYKVRSGVAFIRPRIYTLSKNGGGEIYINSTSLLPVNQDNQNLIVPVGNYPVSTVNTPVVYNPNPNNNKLPANWGFWTNPNSTYDINTSGFKPNYMFAKTYTTSTTNNDWALYPIYPTPAYNVGFNAGNTGVFWTFTAIIAGNNLGNGSTDPARGVYLGITEYDNKGAVLNNNYIAPLVNSSGTAVTAGANTGTFTWQKVSITYKVRAGVATILPRFYSLGNIGGGGELYVFSTTFLPNNVVNPNLLIPNSSQNLNVPPSPNITFPTITQIPHSRFWLPLPDGWNTAWFGCPIDNYQSAEISAEPNQFNPYIAARSYNNQNFAVSATNQFNVQQGTTYIFSAVVAGRNIGRMYNKGLQLRIQSFNQSGTGIDYATFPAQNAVPAYIQGNFPWQIVSCTLKVTNATVKYVVPDFYVQGGGELFIFAATLLPSTVPANLALPLTSTFPQATIAVPKAGPRNFINNLHTQTGKYDADTTINLSDKINHMHINVATNTSSTTNNIGIFSPTESITWTTNPTTVYSDPNISLTYKIVDANGNIVTAGTGNKSGTITLGQSVTLTNVPSGYYELVLKGTAPGDASKNFGPLDLNGKCSAVVIANANTNYNTDMPFGVCGMPDDNGNGLHSWLGFTWDRPLTYNISTGSHLRLPDDPRPTNDVNTPNVTMATYKNDWQTWITAPTVVQKAKSWWYDLSLPKYQKTVEIWNEPNNWEKAILTSGDPGYNDADKGYAPFGNTVAAAQSVLKPLGYKVAVDLEHPWSYTTFNSINNGGYADKYEVMSIHPYTITSWNGISTGPEANAASYSLNDLWGNPILSVKGGNSIPTTLDDLKAYNDVNPIGINKKEIWSTEYGWPSYPGYTWSTSELDQARYIVRSAILQLASNLKKVMVYKWQDGTTDDDSFGLLRADGSPKPSLFAYSNLAHIIGNVPYVGFWGNRNINGIGINIGCAVFSNSTKTIIAVWNPAVESISMQMVVQDIYVFGQAFNFELGTTNFPISVIDIFGNSIPLLPSSVFPAVASRKELMIGKTPIFITFPGAFPKDIWNINYSPKIPNANLFNVGF